MAWNFSLAAEFGGDAVKANAFVRFFDGLSLTLRSKPAETIVVHCSRIVGYGGSIWAMALPAGLGTSGLTSVDERRKATNIGSLLYERLRSAPEYRYAKFGLEVDGFPEFDELGPVLLHPNLHGLVLSSPLWRHFGRPADYLPFSSGYRWRPYQGE